SIAKSPLGMFCGVWLIVFAIWRMSSLASLSAVWIPIIISLFQYSSYVEHMGAPPTFLEYALSTLFYYPLFPIALLITWTHRENIKRIIAGTEHKFGKKKVEKT